MQLRSDLLVPAELCAHLPPPKSCVEASPPEPQNVTIYGDRAFKQGMNEALRMGSHPICLVSW